MASRRTVSRLVASATGCGKPGTGQGGRGEQGVSAVPEEQSGDRDGGGQCDGQRSSQAAPSTSRYRTSSHCITLSTSPGPACMTRYSCCSWPKYHLLDHHSGPGSKDHGPLVSVIATRALRAATTHHSSRHLSRWSSPPAQVPPTARGCSLGAFS